MDEYFNVSDESLVQLSKACLVLEVLEKKVQSEGKKLIDAYVENKNGLGLHSAEIANLLEEIVQVTDDATVPVRQLVLKLQNIISIRKKHIEETKYRR